MEPLDFAAVQDYVNENIGVFHERRIRSLQTLRLNRLLRKNPYLARAKNITTASDMVGGLLDAFLSSSEEQLFGTFLEGLAVFVAQQTSGGHKSTAEGVDLEFINRDTHYVVSVKSGPNWGNSSQQNQLEQNLRTASVRARQLNHQMRIEPVLGICYGKTRTALLERRGYLKVVGQNFWYLISEDKDLYTKIIHPIGFRAREHNDEYLQTKPLITNRITKEFLEVYCTPEGAINWSKLVELTCGNYDLDKFLTEAD